MLIVWSDDSRRISEIAGAAIELGHQYIAITDHTKRLKIARRTRRGTPGAATRARDIQVLGQAQSGVHDRHKGS
jgi:histidinol phosphatase-like PHP family hydrolase